MNSFEQCILEKFCNVKKKHPVFWLKPIAYTKNLDQTNLKFIKKIKNKIKKRKEKKKNPDSHSFSCF